MKVRIGVGAGSGLAGQGQLAGLVTALGEHHFDSLWLSEVLTAPALDPVVGLSWAAGFDPKLKLGTTMLAPGRNPVRLAKSLASLDALSGGRLLLVFVPGLPQPPERDAIGFPSAQRGAAMDEVLPLVRRLWAGETVTHHGMTADFEEVTLSPLPHQDPLEVWLGGNAPAALNRCGRLGDGWLPARCTPDEVVAGRDIINQVADEHERAIDPEHFGISIGYAWEGLSDATARAITARSRGRDASAVVPVGAAAIRTMLEQFVDVGFSKFVLRPLAPPPDWRAELDHLADAVLDLQS